MDRLQELLQRIDGKGYPHYKQLTGSYDFRSFRLIIDHVQGDPFAQPSRISIRLRSDQHGIPGHFHDSRIRQTAVEDWLARATHSAIGRLVKGQRGTGLSGTLAIAVNGQKVLRRNALLIDPEMLEARLLFALPAAGRRILAAEAAEMFFKELPAVVQSGLCWQKRDLRPLQQHIEQVEDQDALRNQLTARKAVAFIADGAILPRRSGIDDRPLARAVKFQSPPELRQTLTLPRQGAVSGMLIPAGVTVIVGGGFHGKSTLLQALEHGVYNHRPGDGRERVATLESAVKIRAEDHRSIEQVDISPFINNLPGARQTNCFSTDNASGSTSQAANIVEALECGCQCLLIDEDTSATNFMLRDQRMQQLVPAAQEPITPFLFRVRELHRQHGISTIIVTGGCGDYLAVADRVLMLAEYRVSDVTGKARMLVNQDELPTLHNQPFCTGPLRRIKLATAPLPRQNRCKIQVREQRLLEYGRRRIDLSLVEQLIDAGQTEAIGHLLAWCHSNQPDQPAGLVATLRQALAVVDRQGLDSVLPWKAGHLAMPRLYELVAAANRLRQDPTIG
ncbi:ABC-ATPase domain-containing protein [Pelobacter seleniigenes]|uniref:ABC-ATPase domain-containing protein n=1 Tax=Pelobacter seleniigenes TaxID=407188 RepID=UPI0004A70732|nr:ABC-ATPase domain-containing protein [Pelobacter seleniigenes]